MINLQIACNRTESSYHPPLLGIRDLSWEIQYFLYPIDENEVDNSTSKDYIINCSICGDHFGVVLYPRFYNKIFGRRCDTFPISEIPKNWRSPYLGSGFSHSVYWMEKRLLRKILSGGQILLGEIERWDYRYQRKSKIEKEKDRILQSISEVNRSLFLTGFERNLVVDW